MDARAMVLQLQVVKANAEAVLASVNAMMATLIQPDAEKAPCAHANVKDAGSTMGNTRAHCSSCDSTFTGEEAKRLLGW